MEWHLPIVYEMDCFIMLIEEYVAGVGVGIECTSLEDLTKQHVTKHHSSETAPFTGAHHSQGGAIRRGVRDSSHLKAVCCVDRLHQARSVRRQPSGGVCQVRPDQTRRAVV